MECLCCQEYNKSNGWNREHVWAKSHGHFKTAMGVGTDLHHLKPTDVTVNGARRNVDFDFGDDFYVDGSIYFSDNKADSWEKLKLPEGVNGPHDLLINPENPEIMYVSCWPQTVDGNDKFGGMIKTSDGGKIWEQVFDERIRVNSAGLDPAQSEKVYFNTLQNAAYRSENNGISWSRIGGYRFKWGQKAVVDINNQNTLFLTTYGSILFYSPADFSPEKEDDIVNMPKGWW